VRGGSVALELVLPDATRLPLASTLTIGRAPGNTIQLSERSVSRNHARIVVDDGSYAIEDTGSSHGTFVDDRRIDRPQPLGPGSRVRLGDVELHLEPGAAEAVGARTLVVPPGETLLVPVAGPAELAPAETGGGSRPRVRSGWALKELDEPEAGFSYVLRDLKGGDFVRLTADDAFLFGLIDGRNTLHELIVQANERLGPGGATRLAALLADLGHRGLLAGVDASAPQSRGGLLAWLVRPRERSVSQVGPVVERLYRRGGWLLFTRPSMMLLALIAAAGLGSFAYLIAGFYGTPFVVAGRVGIGAIVFIVARFLVVVFHELSHALTVVSFGRRVPRAGVKMMLIFPYAFVDTSEAWFEPRRRRIAISAAGPASDLVVGGAAAIAAVAIGAGSMRDVLFQLAFGAYIGALYNLNPLLDRDGYHVLVDLLRQPGLRRRSREWLLRKLTGRATSAEPRAVAIYGIAGLVWSLLVVGFMVLISKRYYAPLESIAPRPVVWTLLGLFYALMLAPVGTLAWRAVAARRRSSNAGVDSVVPA
jgi:putative peptide zinc metalloprotease protein